MSIGKRIAKRRKELKLSQEALGEKLGVSFQAVSSWEREVYIPDISKLDEIARALNISKAWLLEEDEAKPEWELHDEMFKIEHMYNQIRFSANALNFYETLRALPLMKKYHEGQVRKGKDRVPYIIHPLMLACHAMALGLKEDEIIATALLHDVVEDCGAKSEELPVNDSIRAAVEAISYKQQKSENRHDAKLKYYEDIKADRIASIVKLLDRCNNLSMMATGFSKDKMATYIDETEEYVFPLLDHVKHTYPEFYNAAFLIKYQMLSVMETIKRLLRS